MQSAKLVSAMPRFAIHNAKAAELASSLRWHNAFPCHRAAKQFVEA